jgi:NAD(P)-dependent dehydrogenase (short-subunit alcohol dehydrogenase family)
MTISPGVISTAMSAMEIPRVPEMRRFIELAGRIGTVEDIANAAQFLASDLASFLNGSDLLLDGGTIAAMRAEIAISQTGNA